MASYAIDFTGGCAFSGSFGIFVFAGAGGTDRDADAGVAVVRGEAVSCVPVCIFGFSLA